ncbi:MAG: hypothetical protein OXK20_01450 [Deltaproteobacteria bacterium]|nr:hypothetical protein [Deltaproteobacteria bacterium]
MKDLDTAVQALSLEAKWLQEFDVVDPFNDASLRGFLSTRPDHRYGALAVTHVNGEPAPQLVFATPKLHYPFDRQGRFNFPPVREVEIFEKYDGTNVLAYAYHDARGRGYLTYKLRLSPVLRNGRFGAFLDMWKEMLLRYPAIPELVEINDCALGFELYGRRNTHLILYEEPLDCVLLFGVGEKGKPLSPSVLDSRDVPVATLYGTLAPGRDPVAEYAEIREKLECGNRPTEDGKITGVEGAVWYVHTGGDDTVLFKCKPESVEDIHWVAGINKASVTATCWNLFETQDVLTYETLYPLLSEEYADDEIEGFRTCIDECIAEVRQEMEFKSRVMAEYRQVGIKLSENKGEVMRRLSGKFRKQEMKKVFTLISLDEARRGTPRISP